MEKIKYGKTDLFLSRTGMGCLPIQRVSFEKSKQLLLKAYESEINIFDSARAYSDSEEKMGQALSFFRNEIYIATKTHSSTKEGILEQIDISLNKLKTDHIDIYQFHNPSILPLPGDEKGLYDTMLEIKKLGKIRYIGITNHRYDVALAAAKSGLYDSIQYPFNSLSSKKDIELVTLCKEKNIGMLAMKAMSGGLLTNAASSFSFLRQFDNVIPIWGVQELSELEEILGFEKDPPKLDEAMWQIINDDRERLSGSFCRACGYCMPCPQGIQIPMATRSLYMAGRMPIKPFLSQKWKDIMLQTKACTECGTCLSKCPYELDIPALLKKMYEGYEEILLKNNESF